VLEHELLLASTGYGFSKAMAELGSGLKAVAKSINGYNYLSGVPLDLGGDHGPDSQLQSAIRRRQELLANACARIGDDSATLRKFDAAYESIRCFTPMVEDHNHSIDQMGDISMRYPALELGGRCVARGVLAHTADIFHLERADIVEAMNGVDKKDLAAQRKADLEHFAAIVPPPFIGPPPPSSDDPVVDVIVRFFGLPVEPNADPRVINGVAASPGTVTARAKSCVRLRRRQSCRPARCSYASRPCRPGRRFSARPVPSSPIRAGSCRTAPSSRARTASRVWSGR
jgi:hypothetical protein